jgi:hypothetical protein
MSAKATPIKFEHPERSKNLKYLVFFNNSKILLSVT